MSSLSGVDNPLSATPIPTPSRGKSLSPTHRRLESAVPGQDHSRDAPPIQPSAVRKLTFTSSCHQKGGGAAAENLHKDFNASATSTLVQANPMTRPVLSSRSLQNTPTSSGKTTPTSGSVQATPISPSLLTTPISPSLLTTPTSSRGTHHENPARSPGASKELGEAPQPSEVGVAIMMCLNYYLTLADQTKRLVVKDLRMDLRDGWLLGIIVSQWLQKSIPLAPPPLSHSQCLKNIQIIFRVLLEDEFPESDLQDARGIAEGKESSVLHLLCRLLLHYHCTFGGHDSPPRSFQEDLLKWLKTALNRSSVDLTADCWADTPLLWELLCHCCPNIQGVVTGAPPEAMQVAESHLGIPRLFVVKDLSSSVWQTQFLLQVYLAFYVRPSSPAQCKVEHWASQLTSHEAPSLTPLPHPGTPTPPPKAKLTKAPSSQAPYPDASLLVESIATADPPCYISGLLCSVRCGSALSLSSSIWDSGQLLCAILNAMTGHTLPQLNPTSTDDPTSLVHLAFSLVQRHFDMSIEFEPEEFLHQVFPRLMVLEKLYTHRDVPFQPHKSAFITVHSLPNYHQVNQPISIFIDYRDAICSSPYERTRSATPTLVSQKRNQNDTEKTTAKPPSLEGFKKGEINYDWDKLKVSVTERNGSCQKDLRVWRHSHGCLEFSHTPQKLGCYDVAVDYDGKATDGSPLTFQVFDPNQCKFVTQVYKSTCLVGEELSFSVDTSTAGIGHITATLKLLSHTLATPSSDRSPNFNPAAVKVAELKDSITVVSLRMQQVGSYGVDIYYNGLLAKNVRAQVKCASVHVTDMPRYPSVNTNTFFKLATQLPPEDVQVTVEGPQEQQLEVLSHSPYNFSYTASTPGLHTIKTNAGQRTTTTSFYHSNPQLAKRCHITSQPGDNSGVSAVHRTCKYEVSCEGAGKGLLEGQARKVQGKEEMQMTVKADGGVHMASFTPLSPGLYRVHLQWNGQNITDRDGLKLIVCDFSKCKVRSYGIRQVVVNRETFFSVEAPKLTPDEQPPVTVHLSQGRIVSSCQHNKNTWRFSYILEEKPLPSFIQLSVRYYDRQLKDCSFQVQVLEEGPLSQCWFREWPESDLVAKEDITVILDTTQVQDSIIDRLRELEFEVKCEHEDKVVQYEVDRVKFEPNVFSLKFKPPRKGHYSIFTRYRGDCIAENGLDLEVFPRPLFTPDLKPFHYVHVPFNLTVTLDKGVAIDYSYYGYNLEDLVVEVAQEGSVKRRVSGQVSGDSYSVQVCASVVGIMSFTLTHGQLHYQKAIATTIRDLPPPTLTCQEVSHDGQQCVATLFLHSPHSHLAGYTSKKVAVGVKENVELEPALEDLGAGDFLVTLTTCTPDLYKLSLYYYGQLLPVCPFLVDMTMSSAEVMVYDPVIPYELGAAIEIVLDTSKAGPTTTSQLKFIVKDCKDKDLQLKIRAEQESDDLYRLTFVPYKYGIYKAHIWRCDQPIKNSPLILPFEPRGHALANITYRPNLGARVVVTAILREKEANSISTSSLPQLTVQQYQQGQHLIRLHGCQQNVFQLHVFCLGNEVKGSPFEINTTKPPLGIATPPQHCMLRLPKNEYRSHGYLIAELLNDKNEAEISKFTLNNDQNIAHLEISKKTEPWQPCQVQLYWNNVPFCGGPFTLPSDLLTNIDESASPEPSELAAKEPDRNSEESSTSVVQSSPSIKMADTGATTDSV